MASPTTSLRMELFSDAKAHWAAQHRQLFCQHDKDTVVLFRACCEHLGPHATETGSFRGSPCYEKDCARMMWFDTSFLVAMRKSAWGTKSGREVVLAVWVHRAFLEECLSTAVCSDTFGLSAPCGGGRGGGSGGSSGSNGSGGLGLEYSPLLGNNGKSPTLRARHGSGSSAYEASPPPAPPSKPGATMESFFLGSSALKSRGDTGARPVGGGRKVLDAEQDEEEEEGEDRRRAVTLDTPAKAYRFGSPVSGCGGVGGNGSGGGVGGGGDRLRARSHSGTSSSYNGRMTDGVRLHWEPERLPSGEKHRTRRVVQLGLKGRWLKTLGSGDAVVKIERLDGLLGEQRAALISSEPHLLTVPLSRPLDVGHLEDSQLAALHLVNERARPKLRILCLHGYLQNSQIFSQRTRQLCKKLRPTAELVYVDAPHLLRLEELPPPLTTLSSPLEAAAVVAEAAAATAVAKAVTTGEGGAPGMGAKCVPPPPCAAPAEAAAKYDRAGARTWWRCDPEERRRAKAVPGMGGRCEWKGVEESLDFLRKVWEEQGPFDGMLGFSQGAAMASIFNHCAFGSGALTGNSDGDSSVNHCSGGGGGSGGNDGGIHAALDGLSLSAQKMPLLVRPPRFTVFISGCYQPHPTQIPTYPLGQEEAQEELPSLHVWAVEDRFVPAAQSQRLAGMYLRPSVLMHHGSHCVPQTRDIVPHFLRFLEGFR